MQKKGKAMKKSEQFRMAMIAVCDSTFDTEDKLDIIGMLMSEYSLAKFMETNTEGEKQ